MSLRKPPAVAVVFAALFKWVISCGEIFIKLSRFAHPLIHQNKKIVARGSGLSTFPVLFMLAKRMNCLYKIDISTLA